MQTSSTRSPAPEWTIHKLLRWSNDYFTSHDIDSPRATAEILLAHALNLERIDLYLRHDQPLIQEELQRYKSLIMRRVRREPVAYIVGYKEFWSMTLEVCAAVLIPRPETECLVEAARDHLPSGGDSRLQVLELGTGSGAVSLALVSERPGHGYTATDRSGEALSIARRNAEKHGLAGAVRFVCGDWFGPFEASRPRFDMIVSNPPYIASGDIQRLQPEICRFEPLDALDGGQDGLQSIRDIISAAPAFLKSGGRLLLEIGEDQEAAVLSIARGLECYAETAVDRDYAGRPRVARMRLKD